MGETMDLFSLRRGNKSERGAIESDSSTSHRDEARVRYLSEEIDNVLDIIPKEKLAVIRGVHDDFFCDAEVGEYLKKKGIILYEVDAGHTWNKSIAEEVDILVKKFLYP